VSDVLGGRNTKLEPFTLMEVLHYEKVTHLHKILLSDTVHQIEILQVPILEIVIHWNDKFRELCPECYLEYPDS